MTAASKLLIVGPSWIGDMVMAQSLYRLLKERDADAEIHVLAPTWSLPLLDRMPEVAAGIELPLSHGQLGFRARRMLGRRLRAAAFDRAIVLPRSFKAALVPLFAQIPVRTGFRGEWRYGLINDMRAFDPARLNQTVLRFLALGIAAGEQLPPTVPEPSLTVDRAGVLERLNLRYRGPVVALIPGAEYGPAKRWPPEYFGRLAARLAADGTDVWLLGSAKETPLGEAIAAAAGSTRVRNLCGQTSLTDAVDLLAHASVAVSNDSGLMHVAAAVGTHVVALYGSSSPAFTPPLTRCRTIIYRALSCSPCFARECPLRHLDCLRGIGTDQVLAATVTALTERAARSNAPPASRSGSAPP